MGLKAGPDWFGVHACMVCHDIIDGRRPPPEGVTKLDVLECQMRGLERTITHLISEDLIKIKGINL